MSLLPLKKLIPFIFVSLCFILSIWCLTSPSLLPAGSKNIHSKTEGAFLVVIDAGHGGADPGKVGVAGSLEKEINLEIALLLKSILEQQDLEVIMTRETDTELAGTDKGWKLADMKKRVSLINETEPDLVISIHQNSYTTPDIHGAQCFYYSSSESSKQLAQLLQNQIVKSTNQTKIREIKANDDYYLLKKSQPPTVIAECGFLSNPEEEQLLLQPEYQRKMAWAIHLGILKFLNSQ